MLDTELQKRCYMWGIMENVVVDRLDLTRTGAYEVKSKKIVILLVLVPNYGP